jgi:hypothetical protein
LSKPHRKAKNAIGPVVRRLRLAQQPPLSQEALAVRLVQKGVTIDRSALARIESGQRLVKDTEVIAIAAALRMPIGRLFAVR